METFGRGSRMVPAASIDQGMAICDALDRMDFAKKQREYDASIKHGHDFGRVYKCMCGMTEIKYRILSHEARIDSRRLEYCTYKEE